MWTLTKDFRFEASHRLPHHDGKCFRLHGHSFKGQVHLMSPTLIEEGPKQGMVIDYSDVSKVVKAMVDEHLDHYHLNDLLSNPTSENLAQWVYTYLKPDLPMLVAVEIEETCTARCVYQPVDL